MWSRISRNPRLTAVREASGRNSAGRHVPRPGVHGGRRQLARPAARNRVMQPGQRHRQTHQGSCRRIPVKIRAQQDNNALLELRPGMFGGSRPSKRTNQPRGQGMPSQSSQATFPEDNLPMQSSLSAIDNRAPIWQTDLEPQRLIRTARAPPPGRSARGHDRLVHGDPTLQITKRFHAKLEGWLAPASTTDPDARIVFDGEMW